jgi:hypothetical protein
MLRRSEVLRRRSVTPVNSSASSSSSRVPIRTRWRPCSTPSFVCKDSGCLCSSRSRRIYPLFSLRFSARNIWAFSRKSDEGRSSFARRTVHGRADERGTGLPANFRSVCPGGGIGRRTGLKIPRAHALTSSILVPGIRFNLPVIVPLNTGSFTGRNAAV